MKSPIPTAYGEQTDWEKAGLAHRDVEAQLLGMIIIDAAVADDRRYGFLEECADARLIPDDFFFDQHKQIYRVLTSIADRGIQPTLELIEREIERLKIEGLVLADVYVLTRVVEDSTNTSVFAGLLDLVRESALRRLSALETARATQALADRSKTPDELDTVIESHISTLRATQARFAPTGPADDTIDQVVDSYRSMLSEWREHPGELRGTTTGLRSLDDHTRGIHGGDLWVIGARMSMGKTAMALSMLLPAARACKAGHQVAMVSLEMRKEALLHRLCAMLSGESASDIEDAHPSVNWTAVEQALEELAVLPIRLIDAHGAANRMNGVRGKMTVEEIGRYARSWLQEAELDVLFVDYLELLAADKSASKQSRDLQVGGNAIAIKALAAELGIPVVLLAQASRETERRTSRVPTLADLRYSDEIGAVADVVLFPVNWDYYRTRGQELPKEIEEGKPEGLVDIYIAKQRNRAAGAVQAFFLAERMQLVDYNDILCGPVDYHGRRIVRKVLSGSKHEKGRL